MNYSGHLLRQAREKKGVSLQQASQATKIPLEILDNIEADRITSLNPAYLKGYLKIYSAYLGLDTAALLSGYKDIFPDKDSRVIVQRQERTRDQRRNVVFSARIPYALKLFFVVLLALGLVFFLRPKAGKKTKAKPSVVASVSKKKKKAAKPKFNKPGRKSRAGKKRFSSAAGKKTKSGKGPGIRLAIRARENTYVQVKADGRPLFRAVLKKGRTERWSAKERIELSLGSAGGVEVEVNGKTLPSLGRRRQPIKNMIIHRDGRIEIK